MRPQDSHLIDCPYCGETIDVLIDLSGGDQDYIEDCQVCCQPMNISVRVDERGTVSVTGRSDHD
jgi:hypothetical protein